MPFVVTQSVEERFWSKVEKTDGCWEWTGAKVDGYGQFRRENRLRIYAHRFVYELLVGPIPQGLVIDHLCRNRGCVNPNHMEVVTVRENTLRGEGPAAKEARKTHCKWGHEFSPDNTILTNDSRYRQCRTCKEST